MHFIMPQKRLHPRKPWVYRKANTESFTCRMEDTKKAKKGKNSSAGMEVATGAVNVANECFWPTDGSSVFNLITRTHCHTHPHTLTHWEKDNTRTYVGLPHIHMSGSVCVFVY